MALFYVKSTGSRVAGASTADDWSDANCYALLSGAYGQISANGDRIVLNDETYSSTTNLTDAAGAYTFTIESRSSDPTLCILDASTATIAALRLTAPTTAVVPTIKNIGFTASVTHTNANPTSIQVSGVVGNVTVEGCKFSDILNSIGSTSSAIGGLFYSATTARAWTFTDCIWDDITGSHGERATFMLVPSTDTVTLTNPKISNITTTVNGATTGRGLFRVQGDLVITGEDLDNIVFNYPDDGSHNGVFHLDNIAGASVTATTGTVDNVTVTGGSVNGIVFNCNRTYTISGITATGLVATGSPSLNKIGGLCLAITDNADGTISDCEVSNSSGAFGLGMYWSQGGKGTASRMNVHDCTGGTALSQPIEGIAYYAGGWNDQTLEDSIAYNITSVGDPIRGVAVYAQITSTGTAAKTFTMRGCSIAGLTTDATKPAIRIYNDNATYALTANIDNCIIRNGGTNEIDATSTNPITLTVDNCNIEGGQAATTGVDTYTNNVDRDPLFVSDTDLRLGSGSLDRGSGKFIVFGSRDVRGRRRPVPPSNGAYESTAGDPANTRTVSATRSVATNRGVRT